MPKEMEEELKRVASKYAQTGKLHRKGGDSLKQAKDRFVYGTMNKMGYMHARKGAEKH